MAENGLSYKREFRGGRFASQAQLKRAGSFAFRERYTRKLIGRNKT